MSLPNTFKFKHEIDDETVYFASCVNDKVIVDWNGNKLKPQEWVKSTVEDLINKGRWIVISDESLRHFNHPFYKKVDEITEQIKIEQIQKGAEKYPEPFTPDSWTIEQLATHILQELRDAQVYAVGMLDRMEKQNEENKLYKQALEEIVKHGKSADVLTKPSRLIKIANQALEGKANE